MIQYLSRDAWGAREPRGSTPLDSDQVEGIVLHWPGTKSVIGRNNIAGALQGWQNDHMNNPEKLWADIAYQVAVDQWGRVWECRGLTTKSAANGDQDVNERFGAVLLILAIGEIPTDAMIFAVRDVIHGFRAWFPSATKIEPHSAVRTGGTDCPGTAVRVGIAAGVYDPHTAEENDMTPEQASEMLRLLASIDTRLNGMNARIGYLANETAQDIDEMRDKIVGTPE